jgi:DNA replication protein DnaC
MTPISELFQTLKFVSNHSSLTEKQIKEILPVLMEESKAREIKRIRYLLKRSGLKRIKRIDDFDWKFNPHIPREEIMAIYNDSWAEDARNIVFIGPTGVGKSHLGDSFCYQAVQKGLPMARITCYDLVSKLEKSKNKISLLQYYATIKVLCIDELGYVFPKQEQANDIFQIISKRSELLPTLVTTNLVPSKWGKIFEAATATAILDRLSLKGSFITCEGDSYRRRK